MSDHQHFLKLDLHHETATAFATCRGCGETVEPGRPVARGSFESCADPGVAVLTVYCWGCFVEISRVVGVRS